MSSSSAPRLCISPTPSLFYVSSVREVCLHAYRLTFWFIALHLVENCESANCALSFYLQDAFKHPYRYTEKAHSNVYQTSSHNLNNQASANAYEY